MDKSKLIIAAVTAALGLAAGIAAQRQCYQDKAEGNDNPSDPILRQVGQHWIRPKPVEPESDEKGTPVNWRWRNDTGGIFRELYRRVYGNASIRGMTVFQV